MRIAVVTGYNALNLEKHLASNNIVFLRNNQYDKTQMFDSVKLGIEYMKDKVDALVISPMDVPLFTSSTVRKEMASEKSVVIPVCGGRTGHPVFIRAEAFDSILSYRGTDGLRGAITCIESETEYLPADDRGVNVSEPKQAPFWTSTTKVCFARFFRSRSQKKSAFWMNRCQCC